MAALPVLYSFRRCPYAIRARLALAVSGVGYELREVSLKSKPAEMLAASPKGTVPVLVLPGGQVIDESLDIMRWALAQNDPDGWLKHPLDEMLALIAGNDGHFKHALDRYKYPNRYPLESGGDLFLQPEQVSISVRAEPVEASTPIRPFDPSTSSGQAKLRTGQAQGERSIFHKTGSVPGFALAHRGKAASWLHALEPHLSQGWLFGPSPSPSLADIATLPFVRQFAHTDAAWFAAQPWPMLQAWLEEFEVSKLFDTVMVKQEPWQLP